MTDYWIVSGHYDNRQIFSPDEWMETVAEFASEGVSLPDWDQFVGDEIFVLLSDLVVCVQVDTTIYRYEFKRGFVHDKASVPKILQSIVQNDWKDIVIPALVHDFNFGVNFLPFRDSNNVFRDMILISGDNRIDYMDISTRKKERKRRRVRRKANVAYLGVASPIGRSRYYGEEWKRWYMNDFCNVVVLGA